MTLYIGMDMGWKSFRYEVRDQLGRRFERAGGRATPDGLREVLKRFKNCSSVQVAYESGIQLYWTHNVVNEFGMDSYPFHAANFYLNVKSKKKTDKKDAEKIAKAASKENLPPRVVVPAKEEQHLRELIKERNQHQKDLVRYGNRLHSLGAQLGFELNCGCLSERWANWEEALAQFEGTEYEKRARRLYRSALVSFQNIDELNDEINTFKEQEEWQEARKRVTSIPGFGEKTALALLAWCGPQANRFANSRHAASYFGLTGGVYASGTIHRDSGITKCGPPLVRSLLIQVAWAFLRSEAGRNSQWGQWFRKRARQSPQQRKKLIVALARKLLTAAVACLQKGTYWNEDMLTA